MAARSAAVELVASVTAEVADAVADFDHFGSAVKDAGNEADKASDKVRSAADSADDLDSKSAQATGSLGALSSGFELIGADQYAAALQSAALATDFMSGVGEGLNLILELQSVQWLKNKVQTIASAVATRAAAAVTAVMTAAQWALNAAQEASPIGLIILAVIALVAAMVLLYRRSATVRAILDALWAALKSGAQAAGRFAVAALQAIGAAATAMVSWLRSALSTVKSIITTPFTAAASAVADAWAKIVSGAKDLPEKLKAAFGKVKDAVNGALDGIGDGVLDALKGVANDMIDLVNKLIRAFNKLPGPDIPTVSHVSASASVAPQVAVVAGRAPGLGGILAGQARASAAPAQVNIQVTGAVDPESTARQIRRLLESSATRHGGGVLVRGLRTV